MIKKGEADEWLRNCRKAAQSPGFNWPEWFMITGHALSCGCRLFTERKIVDLITSRQSQPHFSLNNKASKTTAYRFLLEVNDADPGISDNRRRVELTIDFEKFKTIENYVPVIVSAWRDNSPHSPNPHAPKCFTDPDNPPCQLTRSRRPRGRIN